MYYLIYISSAVRPMGQEDLIEILKESREKNLRNKVTGLLLYADGNFIQVLEGSREKVLCTYNSITADTRHRNVIKLVSDPIKKRMFPQWSMGFAALSPDKLNELEGFINPGSDLFGANTDHPSIAILKAFAESNRLSYTL